MLEAFYLKNGVVRLNLEQITNKLNMEFNKEDRNLIFWYDEKKEFLEDIENIQLDNVKKLIISENELFKTKVLLEVEDTESNYLIYAPFKRQENKKNHLADIIMYSKIFSTDWTSLIAQELELKDEYLEILKKYNNFFASKERREKFVEAVKQFPINNRDDIEILMMKVITKSKVNILEKFDDIIRILIFDENRKESRYIKEFEKYKIDEKFWEHCKIKYGYSDENPTITKLLLGIFLTYVEIKTKKQNLKKENSLTQKGTVQTFISSLKTSTIYKENFEKLSNEVYKLIDGDKYFNAFDIEEMLELDIFYSVDEKIKKWIIDKILEKDITIKLREKTILQIIEERSNNTLLGEKEKIEYKLLEYAFKIIERNNNFYNSAKEIIKSYVDEDYLIDLYYRKFYYYYDNLNNEKYFKLSECIENKYIDEFLNPITIKFNELLDYNEIKKEKYIKLQNNFYKNNVETNKNRIVVIISDALRYEIGKEMVDIMNNDEKIEAEIDTQISFVPSITKLGMATLLPHKKIEVVKEENNNFKVLVDGKNCNNKEKREIILKEYDEKSVAVNFNELQLASRNEVREIFRDKKKIYIYHNKIDASGDNLQTEREVFNACEKSISEIIELVKRLGGDSVNNIVITSDHGFIYKRKEIEEYDKIENFSSKNDIVNKRYIITENDYDIIGTKKIELKEILNNEDEKNIVICPNTSNIFKVSGGGRNYFHGGTSLQELIVPIIKVKTKRGVVNTEIVELIVLSGLEKINSLVTKIEIYQKDSITDIIKEGEYQLYFEDENKNIISNIENFRANIKSDETYDRIKKIVFSLKNQKYDKKENYYFIVKNLDTGIELIKRKVEIDPVF